MCYMLETIALVAMLQSVQNQTEGIHCLFPADDGGGKTLQVVLDPMPSLKDQPGLYRVFMEIEGQVTLKAAAQPIATTEDRDVLFLARHGQDSVFTLGVQENGQAALSQRTSQTSKAKTRLGVCAGAAQHINRWLPS